MFVWQARFMSTATEAEATGAVARTPPQANMKAVTMVTTFFFNDDIRSSYRKRAGLSSNTIIVQNYYTVNPCTLD